MAFLEELLPQEVTESLDLPSLSYENTSYLKRNAKNRSAKMTEREKILEQLADPNIHPSKRRFLEDKLK